MVAYENPVTLLSRLKLGREEYLQRLLTALVVGGAYPKWNSRNQPSPAGLRYLRLLDERCFGGPAWPGEPTFVDEFDLPPIEADDRGGAPDQAALWPDRLWLIELKAERGSHRPAQLPGYLTLAAHHHPGLRVDITYVTPPMVPDAVSLPAGSRYSHLEWSDIVALVEQVWTASAEGAERAIVAQITRVVADLDNLAAGWRTRILPQTTEPAPATPRETDPLAAARELARQTAADGTQRALVTGLQNLEDMLALRIRLCDDFATDPELDLVQPWLWRAATSTGQPLDADGRDHGYEIRLSRRHSRHARMATPEPTQ
ncbi:MAG: hypothetical protein ACJ73S_03410 [Mycobacteriales bacterium]